MKNERRMKCNLINYKLCFTALQLRLGSTAVLWTKKRVWLNDSNLFFSYQCVMNSQKQKCIIYFQILK